MRTVWIPLMVISAIAMSHGYQRIQRQSTVKFNPETYDDGKWHPEKLKDQLGFYIPDKGGKYLHLHIPYSGGFGNKAVPYVHFDFPYSGGFGDPAAPYDGGFGDRGVPYIQGTDDERYAGKYGGNGQVVNYIPMNDKKGVYMHIDSDLGKHVYFEGKVTKKTKGDKGYFGPNEFFKHNTDFNKGSSDPGSGISEGNSASGSGGRNADRKSDKNKFDGEEGNKRFGHLYKGGNTDGRFGDGKGDSEYGGGYRDWDREDGSNPKDRDTGNTGFKDENSPPNKKYGQGNTEGRFGEGKEDSEYGGGYRDWDREDGSNPKDRDTGNTGFGDGNGPPNKKYGQGISPGDRDTEKGNNFGNKGDPAVESSSEGYGEGPGDKGPGDKRDDRDNVPDDASGNGPSDSNKEYPSFGDKFRDTNTDRVYPDFDYGTDAGSSNSNGHGNGFDKGYEKGSGGKGYGKDRNRFDKDKHMYGNHKREETTKNPFTTYKPGFVTLNTFKGPDYLPPLDAKTERPTVIPAKSTQQPSTTKYPSLKTERPTIPPLPTTVNKVVTTSLRTTIQPTHTTVRTTASIKPKITTQYPIVTTPASKTEKPYQPTIKVSYKTPQPTIPSIKISTIPSISTHKPILTSTPKVYTGPTYIPVATTQIPKITSKLTKIPTTGRPQTTIPYTGPTYLPLQTTTLRPKYPQTTTPKPLYTGPTYLPPF